MNMIGHNNPPDPIDEAVAPYADTIAEAENWLDGTPVENEDQMKAVDALIAQMRKATADLGRAKRAATAPLHDAWKAEVARWKPTEDDMERIKTGLVAVVDAFKRKLAAQKEAERQDAFEAAERARRKAEAKAAAANAADLEAQREAAAAAQAAIDAQKAAVAASKDTVKGLRKVTRFEVRDYKAAINWIAQNDREAVIAFVDEYARRNHKEKPITGVEVWQEKEAF